MKPVVFFALALLAVPALAETLEPVTTVILVRHAEKTSETESDPPLSDAGRERAGELARVLAATKIDAIYTTQYVRTRDTAVPVAKALAVEPKIFRTSKTYAADLARHIRTEHKGQTVLVVGHSNSTVDVLRQLGAVDPRPIPESQFDDFFVVTLAGDHVNVIPLRYGAPTR